MSSIERLKAALASSGYRPVRNLARGGMGDVYVVEHVALAELRVMKLLRPELSSSDAVTRRLWAEARMLTRVAHPNLVRVLDLGMTLDGRAFLVTELLRGETLKERMGRQGGASVTEAIQITIDLLRGLEAVHEAELVHRDIKPDNVFLATQSAGRPCVKILDFGIAKVLSPELRRQVGQIAPTAEGMMLGTPSFLSPEQVEAGPIDARTDVYGAGGLLHALLTGKPPFVRANEMDLLRAHCLEPATAPSQCNPEVPPALDEIVLRALAKAPSDRFPSAIAMRVALEVLLANHERPPTPTTQAAAVGAFVEAPPDSSADLTVYETPRSRPPQPLPRPIDVKPAACGHGASPSRVAVTLDVVDAPARPARRALRIAQILIGLFVIVVLAQVSWLVCQGVGR